MAYIELNEEERANFFMQFFNDLDADEEFEGFDEFDIAENIEIVGGIDIEQAENDRDIRDDVEAGWSRAVDCSFPLPVLSHSQVGF